ncbi:glycosyltransferase family 2 protein [Niabella hirudinis]|uniref:glycosyltransferase family 2 protein n=1 Tax=Niabella hirudinis TaxID=1285929 RepID=UPI003EBBFDF5
MQPFISICVPAYQRPLYLKRLLDSIVIQDFEDYEVIVTDDSPDDTVRDLCASFDGIRHLTYHKNPTPLGTPSNWNAAIKQAKGAWIKLMHDDDWFAGSDALQQFAACAKANDDAFIFSAYSNVYEHNGPEKEMLPQKSRIRQTIKEPTVILAHNFIGPPSTTLHRNDGRHWYDPKLKWLVDIDMYQRRMQTDRLVYINKPLIKFYVSHTQVTAYTKNVGKVEIPEHFYFLEKTGIAKLRNLLVYDYNWRFIRNFNISNQDRIAQYGYNGPIHPVINAMIRTQSKIPRALLNNSFASKALMFLHYIRNRNRIR